MKFEFFWTDVRKKFQKYHEIPCSVNRVVLCPKADRQTEMTKVIVAFHTFGFAPINACINLHTNSSEI